MTPTPPTVDEMPVALPVGLPVASPRVALNDTGQPLDRRLYGVILPPAEIDGPDVLDQWLVVVEMLLGRGVRRPGELGQVLGIPTRVADAWLVEVRRRFGEALAPQRLETRKAELYAEADAVSRVAFDSLGDVVGKDRASLLKAALEANKRKAALIGADVVRTENATTTTVNVTGTVDVEVTHGLPPGTMSALGAMLAQSLTAARSGALPPPAPARQVIDVEAEPVPPKPSN